MFKRKIYDSLLEWKRESDVHTAVLIERARRIGKSTVAEEFGKNEYESYIHIWVGITNGVFGNKKDACIITNASSF